MSGAAASQTDEPAGAPSDAALIAALLAIDPVGTGGVCLRSPPQPIRDEWLALLRSLLPPGAPLRRIPCTIGDDRLLGGLDLVATLKAGRPVAERGVLAAADGGIALIAMAERLPPPTAARVGSVLDSGEIELAREGVALSHPARIGLVALDEGMSEEERVPACLLDRLAFLLDLGGVGARAQLPRLHAPAAIEAARRLLPRVRIDAAVLDALCATALALGAGSTRVSLLALKAAQAAAALAGRTAVSEADAVLAARLVFAPRATLLPPAPPPPDAGEPSPQPLAQEPPAPPPEGDGPSPEPGAQELKDVVLAAARAAIPQGLLETLRAERASRTAGGRGRAGALRGAGARGRPAGVRSGAPRAGARLNVVETLRAAAPWQRLRGRGAESRVRIEPADLRVTRYKQRSATLTIFAVDASGSSALNRLAEAKGAVELLLADCYIRRDQVAVIAFRGRGAEMLLPPTRSLVRAKRALAGLPGGGGTPLAAAILLSAGLAAQARRRGETPTVVLLTDGRANVARDGSASKQAAHAQALDAARTLREGAIRALFIDTSPRANPLAKQIADAMAATYIALPQASAGAVSALVKARAGGGYTDARVG